jgi:hypothetical protein
MKNFFREMNSLSQIILVVAPLAGTMFSVNHFPVYVAPVTHIMPLNKSPAVDTPPPDLYPKNECNFGTSSNIASKKIKYFTYDCVQPTNNWLLINISEANYYDVLRK